ncbi:hypothetical protein [Enterobacter cloacae complex sp. I2]|uniref:hypothetical protein n=1 Tax=Enterobacter cloacae complex sp. I2 TaxID=2779603 RepID=UPI0018661798|nr:hypothetical protein [Enterobacter cloacae complex sp. I2]EKS7429349.1 hypothetical protein [Enterobacter cancerogenus]MBE3513163.1 hypothetical protein [Enterobacter cloacae complex sp. I2]
MSRRTNPYRQELRVARSQRKRLQTIKDKITDMSVEWDGLSGGLECDFNMMAEEIEKQLDVLDAQIGDWTKGYGDGREVE